MMPFVPDEIFIERTELDTPLVRTVLERVGERSVRVVDDVQAFDTKDFAVGKRRLLLQRHRGSFLHSCPAGTAGLVCCNYLVMNFASNCPFDCSYCFLQSYLANNAALKAFTNVGNALDEVSRVLGAHPQRRFRIGTGELADSLALDPITGLSRFLVPFFAERPNVVLELKTKTDCIDDLLALDPKERVVVSWSMNAPSIIASDEQGTASFESRVRAACRVQAAGYRLGFHFDPLVEFEGWETEYPRAVAEIFSAIDPRRVAWVSLGSLRLTPELTGVIRRRGRFGRVLGAELVAGRDGKARVWYGLRLRMYRALIRALREVSDAFPIYLCMETADVWERVMSEVPSDRVLGARLAAGAAW